MINVCRHLHIDTQFDEFPFLSISIREHDNIIEWLSHEQNYQYCALDRVIVEVGGDGAADIAADTGAISAPAARSSGRGAAFTPPSHDLLPASSRRSALACRWSATM